MNCLHCGKPLKDGARFCSFCGTPVGVTPQNSITVSDNTVNSEIRKPRQSKKRYIGRVVLIVLVVAVLMAVCLTVGILMRNKDNYTHIYTSINAYISESGEAYICYGDGKYIAIEENGVTDARLSPDRDYIGYLTEDGELICADIKQSERYVVAEGDIQLLSMTKTYMIYAISDHNELYVYEYATGDNAVIPQGDAIGGVSWCISPTYNEESAVAYFEGGDIYAGELFGERQHIAHYTDDAEIDLFGISGDANVVLFGVTVDGDNRVYLYYHGDVSQLDTFSDTEYRTGLSLNVANDDSETVVIASLERIFIKTDDSLNEVPMNSNVYLHNIANAHGRPFSEEGFIGADGFYVMRTDKDSDVISNTLCYMSYDGTYREVVKRFTHMRFVGQEGIVCTNEDNELIYISMDVEAGIVTGEPVTIAKNVYDFEVSDNGGNFIYYTYSKFVSFELYCYDILDDSVDMISDDVHTYYVSTDGESVFYTRDGHGYRGDVNIDVAELYVYNGSFEESELVAEDVIINSVTSHLLNRELDTNGVWFETFVELIDGGYMCHSNVYTDGDVREVIRNVPKK